MEMTAKAVSEKAVVRECLICEGVAAAPGDDLCAECRALLDAAGVVRMNQGASVPVTELLGVGQW